MEMLLDLAMTFWQWVVFVVLVGVVNVIVLVAVIAVVVVVVPVWLCSEVIDHALVRCGLQSLV